MSDAHFAESVRVRWVPDYWLIVYKKRFRWHWELRNLTATPWASGTARTFEEAKEAGVVRAEIGPTGYLPERPDPGIPEVRPRVNYLPIQVRRNRRQSDGGEG